VRLPHPLHGHSADGGCSGGAAAEADSEADPALSDMADSGTEGPAHDALGPLARARLAAALLRYPPLCVLARTQY
jgi:hypothetical protein